MKKAALAIFIAIILTGCGPSRIHDNYRQKGLTKGQRVKNSLIHVKRTKKLKKIFAKIINPKW